MLTFVATEFRNQPQPDIEIYEVRNGLRNEITYCRLDCGGGELCVAKAMAAVVDFHLFVRLHNFR